MWVFEATTYGLGESPSQASQFFHPDAFPSLYVIGYRLPTSADPVGKRASPIR